MLILSGVLVVAWADADDGSESTIANKLATNKDLTQQLTMSHWVKESCGWDRRVSDARWGTIT